MTEEVLRLGISAQAAAQGAREYRRATEDVAKAAASAATANDELTQATKRLGTATQEVSQRELARRAQVDAQVAARKRMAESMAAVERATRTAERAERAYQETMAHVRVGAAQGIITPQQAAQEGREAAMAYNAALAQALQQESSLLQRSEAGRAAFVGLSEGLKDTEVSANRSSLGMGRLNNALMVISRQALGVHPAMGQAADAIGTFAIGTAYMTGVFAGLAALGLAYRELTEDTRKAKEEQERYLEVLKQVDRMAEPGKELADALKNQREQLEALDRQRETARASAGVAFGGEGAELQRMVYQKQADELDKQYEELAKLVADGEEELAEIRARAAGDSLRNTQEFFRRSGEEQQRAQEERARQAKQAADEEARALKEAIDTRLQILDVFRQMEEGQRALEANTEALIAVSARERFEAEAMLAAKKAGKEAEDALTVALAMQAAVRENLGRVTDAALAQHAENVRAKTEDMLATQALAEAERALERQREEAARAEQQRRQFYLSTGLQVAGAAVGSSGVGRTAIGAVGAGMAGFAVAGPVGAAVGAIGAVVTGIIGMSKAAREERERQKEEERQRRSAEAVTTRDLQRELAERELAATGHERLADQLRREHDAADQVREAWLATGNTVLVAELRRIQALEEAKLAAEQAAEAEQELAEARERAAQFVENTIVRALQAMGNGADAARAGLSFSQRRELADAAPEDRETLFVLHEMERNQLELNLSVASIEAAANEQIDRLDQQIRQQEEQLRLAEEQISVHRKALEQAERVVEAIRAFRDRLKLGPLSVLSPADRLTEARGQFETLRGKALKGDADAAGQLPAAAQALLEASREFNASGAGYVADYERVVEVMEKVQAEFADRATIEEAILKELERQTTRLNQQIKEMEVQRRTIQEEAQAQIAALREEFNSKQNTLWSIIQKLLGIDTGNLSDIAKNTNEQKILRAQIEARDLAYTDLNGYWVNQVAVVHGTYKKQLEDLVKLLNQYMGTGQRAAAAAEQNVIVAQAGFRAIEGRLAELEATAHADARRNGDAVAAAMGEG